MARGEALLLSQRESWGGCSHIKTSPIVNTAREGAKKKMSLKGRPVLFGEVLFDVFEDGEVVGGAPFNVARHLHAFGADPLFVTAVGEDERGRRILELMEREGMATDGVQVSPQHPTGTARVTVRDDEPSFELVEGVAYDHIPFEEEQLGALTKGAALVYHGTLALRNGKSRSSLERLLKRTGASVFVDLNLRPPHVVPQTLLEVCRHATWLKVNRDELFELAKAEEMPEGDVPTLARQLIERNSLAALLLTVGEEGASIFPADEPAQNQDGASAEPFRDAVGAGDGFSAVVILGLLRGWPWTVILDRAVTFAGQVCTVKGAVPPHESFYQKLFQQWGVER